VEQARGLLKRLIDKPLYTITQEKLNLVRTVEGDYAYVEREQSGRVPIADVQAAIDALYRDGKLRINKATLGHSNTAFVRRRSAATASATAWSPSSSSAPRR
jgi:hypothetical protein